MKTSLASRRFRILALLGATAIALPGLMPKTASAQVAGMYRVEVQSQRCVIGNCDGPGASRLENGAVTITGPGRRSRPTYVEVSCHVTTTQNGIAYETGAEIEFTDTTGQRIIGYGAVPFGAPEDSSTPSWGYVGFRAADPVAGITMSASGGVIAINSTEQFVRGGVQIVARGMLEHSHGPVGSDTSISDGYYMDSIKCDLAPTTDPEASEANAAYPALFR